MVFVGDISIVNADYKPTYNWGAPPCMSTIYCSLPVHQGLVVACFKLDTFLTRISSLYPCIQWPFQEPNDLNWRYLQGGAPPSDLSWFIIALASWIYHQQKPVREIGLMFSNLANINQL